MAVHEIRKLPEFSFVEDTSNVEWIECSALVLALNAEVSKSIFIKTI